MKLGEFEIDDRYDKAEDIGLFVLNRIPVGVTEARVEIHTLEDPPWPTKRPPGWGVGWWCEYKGHRWLCIRVYTFISTSDSVRLIRWDDGVQRFHYPMISAITAFGPRAEVPCG